ncbi:PUP1 [Bugula neritina]|uniref:PUP1 n=1 Tax=Bugula neritina TaxID=10212 RepID=A0A7J7KG53_BUGNE|nr:PUP1 [Bugula neritina]
MSQVKLAVYTPLLLLSILTNSPLFDLFWSLAGTAADTEYTTNMVAAQLELHSLNTGRVSRVTSACQLLKQYLFRYQGHIGAALYVPSDDLAALTWMWQQKDTEST